MLINETRRTMKPADDVKVNGFNKGMKSFNLIMNEKQACDFSE